MKRQICFVMLIAVIMLLASGAFAVKPTVTVYYDEALTQTSPDGLSPGLNTVYVVAEGFNASLASIEYKLDYPPGLTWVQDLDGSVLKIGSTGKGITQAFTEPLDAYSPVVVARVQVRWNPDSGVPSGIAVEPHPVFGFIRAAAAPDYRIIEAYPGKRSDRQGDPSQKYGDTPELAGVSPNPFNPVTQITYWVPRDTRVSLAIYDVNGRLIETLVNGEKERGEHTVSWRAKGLSSGVYFCRFTAGDFSENRKVMLIK